MSFTAEAMGRQALDISMRLGEVNQAGWACGVPLFAAFVLGRRDGVAELSRTMLDAGRSPRTSRSWRSACTTRA
ncbi:MAG TPA: hypothetical protein VKK19_17510 [Candidatus Dormibacteraeota bacterium]|nr:hypothetical protein [Candidatus Dormibacteraeota bacterium]